MVAIFSGLGSGLVRSSASSLGALGLLGSGALGRGGEGVSINAANGNLLVSQQDEFLSGLGLDVAVGRTYTPLGKFNNAFYSTIDAIDPGVIATMETSGVPIGQALGGGLSGLKSLSGLRFGAVAAEGAANPLATVFRGERASMTPEQVFANGLSPKGDNLDLLWHATANSADSGFIATSSKFDIAHSFAGRNGYIYEIAPEGGINVNARLGAASPFPEQMEIAIPRGVSPTNVKGAYPLSRGALTGDYILNPLFRK